MVSSKYFLKYCLLATEISSIFLLVLTLLFLISGYGITRTSVVKKLTFGLINMHVAMQIHTNIYFRIVFNIFLTIHCLTGLTIILYRRIRNTLLRTCILVIVTTIVLYFIIPLILIDLID